MNAQLQTAQISDSNHPTSRALGVCALLFSLCVGAFVGALALLLPSQLTDIRLCDAWFGADICRRFIELTNHMVSPGDAYKHPFFQFLFFPVRLMTNVLKFAPWNAMVVLLTVNAVVWSLLCWTILYKITQRVADTIIYSLLLLSTAACILWLPVMETYAFGSTSILIPLAILTVASLRSRPLVHAGAFVVSAGVTITNAMFSGIAQLVSLKPLRMAFSISVALGVLLLGTVVHRMAFPRNKEVALAPGSVASDWSLYAKTKPLSRYARDFFLDPVIPRCVYSGVVPKHYAQVEGEEYWPPNRLPSVDTIARYPGVDYHVLYKPHSLVWNTAIACWLLVVAGGLFGLIQTREERPLRMTLAAGLLGQFVLHSIYGHETAIYTLHWMPPLVLLAAFGSRTSLRKYLLPVAVCLALLCLYSNLGLYHALVRYMGTVDLQSL